MSFHGRSHVIKSQKALAFAAHVKKTVPVRQPLIEGDISIVIEIYYKTRRPDLDESLILDVLQGIAYVNDRQVKEKHIYWGLDPDHPRVIVQIFPVQTGHRQSDKGRSRGKRQRKAGRGPVAGQS